MRRTIAQISPSLSVQVKEIVLGGLLGDGSLKVNDKYKNARYSFRHSMKQKDYFFWKVNQLKEISNEKCFWEQDDGKIRYQSLALESLTEIHLLTNQGNKLYIRRKWLNLLTPMALAVWWLDDGSLVKNSRQGVLCTDGFDVEAQKILAKYLQKVWGIETKIGKTAKIGGYYRIWFRSTEMLKKFLRIILPYVKVENMLPKTIILYNDPILQQRWISEIIQLTGFDKSVVEEQLAIKRAKYKKFQKMI